jgi:DsbC/DsbD-like thiol-disulfide interchange protein
MIAKKQNSKCSLHERVRILLLKHLAVAMLMLLFAACSRISINQNDGASSGGQASSESVVLFSAEPVEIAANTSTEAVVHVKVKDGYHVNANPPTYSYLKPIELELKPGNGFSVGFITYPDPTVKKFPFADKPLSIYEGDTALKILLKADAAASKGSSNLAGKLKVQACDDQVCYPPGEISIAIPVIVK